MLTREECLIAYNNLYDGSYDKGHDFQVDYDVIKQLIEEHFENTPDFKPFKMYADSTLKSMPKDDLIDYIHMIYLNWKNCDIQLENKIKLSNRLYNKLVNIHKNPPLKFEELKENMWVFDNKYKDYVKLKRNDNENVGKIIIFSKGGDEEYLRMFNDNRFYRREVKE